jgi:chemotaxis protein MotB
LIESLEDMKVLKAKIKTLEQQKDTLQAHTSELEKDYAVIAKEMDSNKALIQIGQYRSEFFSKLLKVLGSRKDIRIVGDRFIFQSEVLFDKASADLGAEGKERLDQLVKALMEIGKTIPPAMSWILRVDGHTDQLPIKNSNYPSNWELSAARSIAVVKYLVSKGIPESRLVAAGFGQHQPLIAGATEGELARNRRIEFKLDQR